MPYRGPNTTRMLNQSRDQFQHAGQTATLRIFVSGWTGTPALGLGGGSGYQNRTITALFREQLIQAEMQGAGGLVAAAQIKMTCREKVTRNDQIVWNGIDYRVDSDPVFERIFGAYVSEIKRSEP